MCPFFNNFDHLAVKIKNEVWFFLHLYIPVTNIEPKLGEGIFLVKDVAHILDIDYQKTYRWIVGYWGSLDGALDSTIQYSFGEVGNRAINFLSLIEFYTFFKLREQGVSSFDIKDLHRELSIAFNTPYPFAKAHDFWVENRKRKKFVYFGYVNNIVRVDKRHQISFKFVEKFLDKIEFDDNNLAARYFPLSDSRNVVVDPNHQFGQPVIFGTNIKTTTLNNLYEAGETVDFIARLYDLTTQQVDDAIKFYGKAA